MSGATLATAKLEAAITEKQSETSSLRLRLVELDALVQEKTSNSATMSERYEDARHRLIVAEEAVADAREKCSSAARRTDDLERSLQRSNAALDAAETK